MRRDKIFLVFKKDWHEISRNWQVTAPIIAMPLMIAISLPFILNAISNMASLSGSSTGVFEAMIRNLPRQLRQELTAMTYQQAIFYMLSSYLVAPVFLIIPLLTSSVIASDSFAGEKERKTIEALLATPITDGELFLGKVLVSFTPSMAITLTSFLVYSIIIDIFSSTLFNGELLLPNLLWGLLIVGLAPTIAFASIGLTVMISFRVRGFREAQQLSAFLMIPIMIVAFGQVSGAIILGPVVLCASIGLFAMFDVILFNFGLGLFGRDEILSKLS